ncbi:histone H4-like TAF Taf6, SAGA complex subunit [Malassezia vespertilionis]|uniref:histone H4-like TAF Taf6, SAGA complex subunit n=1 Tax=Malassezia vespertilionis TaxID=2020962 RepID=UPI0024B20BB1|nr:histone H4-like TAF Taf6, SAGA complex subunit [Malassezia vespertilionis]WFD04915.1 histone H4-like TAF Taf6, SAGA complex subunit [Malassezia vespertilionis]
MSTQGAKRSNGNSSFSGTGTTPVFGPSIPLSVYPKDSVKDVAESLGITNIRDNVAVALATDIEYRIRDVAESAAKYMKHAKRTRMTTADVDNALRQKNIEPLYGFFPPYTSGKAKGPWFRPVRTPSGAPIYMADDDEVDFDSILESGPRLGVGRGVGWHAHWLAIEGIQPPVPENPVFLARQSASQSGILPDPSEAAAELGSTAVKPLVKHVLSRELQLYYERLTNSISNPPQAAFTGEPAAVNKAPSEVLDTDLAVYTDTSSGNTVRDAALASLRGDAGIHQLVPYVIQWVGANVTFVLRGATENGTNAPAEQTKDIELMYTMLNTLHALLVNPSIFIEPYLHQLMPSVLSILLAVYGTNEGTVDMEQENAAIGLRVYAATLLTYIIDRFGDSYPTLQSRVVATLLQALFSQVDDGTSANAADASGSLHAKFGALIALRKLGPASFKTLLGSIATLPPLDAVQERNPNHVPLHALGTWLEQLQQKQGHEQFLVERILKETQVGLDALGQAMDGAPRMPDKAMQKRLTEVYGPFWAHVLDGDASGWSALAAYYRETEENS